MTNNHCDPLCEEIIEAKLRLDEGKKILDLIPAMAKNIEALMARDEKLKVWIDLQDDFNGLSNIITRLRKWILITAPILAFLAAIGWAAKKLGLT